MRLGRRAATVPRDGAQGEMCRAPGATTGARCSGMASWPTARSCLPLCCLKTPGRPTAMKHSPSVNIIMPTEPVVRYCHTALPIAAALSTFPSLTLDMHRLGLTRCALAWTAQAARTKTAGTFLCYRSSACRTASSAACQWAPSAWPPFSRSRASVRLCWTPAVGARRRRVTGRGRAWRGRHNRQRSAWSAWWQRSAHSHQTCDRHAASTARRHGPTCAARGRASPSPRHRPTAIVRVPASEPAPEPAQLVRMALAAGRRVRPSFLLPALSIEHRAVSLGVTPHRAASVRGGRSTANCHPCMRAHRQQQHVSVFYRRWAVGNWQLQLQL